MAIGKETGTGTKTASRARPPRQQTTVTPRATQQRGKANKAAPASIEVSPEERWRMVAVAAYHKAEQRGFPPGGEVSDWLEAEKEVDVLLGGSSR